MIEKKYVLIPVEMAVYVLRKNIESTFKFFILLKLIYTPGKTRLSKQERQFISFVSGLSERTLAKHVDKMIQFGWLRRNNKTGYYIIRSIDKLRLDYNWKSRSSVEFYLSDLPRIKSLLGATIFTYLHELYWRKDKRREFVVSKGATFQALPPSFNYQSRYAPISVYGIEKLFMISKSKMSRLKNEAHDLGLLKIKKDYKKLDLPDFTVECIKDYYSEISNRIRYREESYWLQGIDLVLPCISLRRRKKLGP